MAREGFSKRRILFTLIFLVALLYFLFTVVEFAKHELRRKARKTRSRVKRVIMDARVKESIFKNSKDVPSDPPLKRVCGSPAIDGYAHVNPECLFNSPTNKAWIKLHPNGGKSGEGLACNIEEAVSIDGLAVGWGIGNKKSSPEECCQACRDHDPNTATGAYAKLPCNAWVYCPLDVCFEADAHKHTKGDCWLKFTEAPQSPEINARGYFTDVFRKRHPDAPDKCPWISGVLLPPGQVLTNGTWGPRASW